MGLYVFLTRNINRIGGAELYLSRKIEYLEEREWKVLVLFYDNEGECLIPNLAKYQKNFFPQLRLPVGNVSKTIKDKILSIVTEYNALKVVIESFSPELAVWGEYISSQIKGKHFVYLIDESLSPLTSRMKDFLLYKINQNLLYCIKKQVIESSLPSISDSLLYNIELAAQGCNYGNVASIKDEVVECISSDRINIVSLGRLEKPYMRHMVNSVVLFCKSHPNLKFNFIFAGDTRDRKIKNVLFDCLKESPNIELIHLGYKWPLPKELFKKANVVLASAGSARVGHQEGVPTICIDSKDYEAIGLFGINTDNTLFRSPQDPSKTILQYLEEIIIDKLYSHYAPTKLPLDYSEHQSIIDLDFKHDYYKDILKTDFLNHILARKIIIKFDNTPILKKLTSLFRNSLFYKMRYKI